MNTRVNFDVPSEKKKYKDLSPGATYRDLFNNRIFICLARTKNGEHQKLSLEDWHVYRPVDGEDPVEELNCQINISSIRREY